MVSIKIGVVNCERQRWCMVLRKSVIRGRVSKQQAVKAYEQFLNMLLHLLSVKSELNAQGSPTNKFPTLCTG